jgi:hypothetical protein
MSAFALTAGVARGAQSLSAEHLLAQTVKPVLRPAKHRHVSRALIRHYRTVTWRWQAVMGRRRARIAIRPNTVPVLRSWRRAARRAYVRFVHPPHKSAWLCIHRYEGSWSDSGDPYWGGLQMDRGFMGGYAPHYLLRRGFADHWSPLEQMWVAERAYRSGRGFSAWPNTARLCGVL